MTEEERLCAELELIEKDIERCIAKIEALKWQWEILNDAILTEADLRIRGELVQQQGRVTDQILLERDRLPDFQAQKREVEVKIGQEREFKASREVNPDVDCAPDRADEADLAARRKLRRDRKNRIGGR